MDQLLFFALFVLFSVVSALLERRKRRQSLEEARQRRETSGKPAPAAEKTEEPKEEKSWPWPEIFEQAPARPRRVEREQIPAETVSAKAPAAATLPGEGQHRRAEEELREMARRVQEMDQRAREAERRSLDEYRLMEEQAASRMGAGAGPRQLTQAPEGEARPRRQGWGLTPREARRAVIYAEILGPPKSERRE